MPKRLLVTGPCPGLWRTYYSATIHSTQAEAEIAGGEYLGRELPEGATRNDVGDEFELWVRQANQVYNSFLESGNVQELDRIVTPGLREFYKDRAVEHREFVSESSELMKAMMKTRPKLKVLPRLPIARLTPDGLFKEGEPGAIFESKINRPRHPEFRFEMATYGIVAEHIFEMDFDFAVILHGDYPKEDLQVYAEPINDSYVAWVSENLERFHRLIQFSLVERGGPNIGRNYTNWSDFVVRPPGVPDLDKRAPCGNCRYRLPCYPEGGEFIDES